MDYKLRQNRWLATVHAEKLDGMLVAHMANVRYLCGFTGSSGVLVGLVGNNGNPRLAFFSDGRYAEQAEEEVTGAKIVITKTSAMTAASEWLKKNATRRASIGFEAEHTSYSAQRALATGLGAVIKLVATNQMVERLRMIKEPAEVERIRQAVNLASSVYDVVVTDIRPGVAENLIAAEIEYLARRMGAEGMAFETIVASGKRSAMPHGRASQKSIEYGGFVVLDFGVILAGYCSDMTRTVYVGCPNKKEERIYNAVLMAQLAGIKAVKAGIETWKVDYEARKILDKYGLSRYFNHSTGHGVGIEIHEPPGIRTKTISVVKHNKSGKAKSECLEAGMIVTIEPGVYIPGYGGVRIEDMVLVTENGYEVLTPTSKELIAL